MRQETDVVCTIEGEPFFVFTKCMKIGDSGPSCCIMSDYTGMHMSWTLKNLFKAAQAT